MKIIEVAVSHIDLYDRGQATTEASRKSPFGNTHAFDRVWIERTKYAEHVGRIINRNTIYQDQILVNTTATHVDTGSPFRTALYTGHELQRLKHVGFPESRGQFLSLFSRNVVSAHLALFLYSPDPVCSDLYCFQLDGTGKSDIHAYICGRTPAYRISLVAYVAINQVPLPHRYRQAVNPKFIGRGSFLRSCFIYGRTDQFLS